MNYKIVRTFLEKPQTYEGSQLRPFFSYEVSGERGDGIVAFVGPMQLSSKEMIDMEDVLENDKIWSPLAINFIVEMFHINIETAVLYQRTFMQCILDELHAAKRTGELFDSIEMIVLDGDDIMVSVGGELKKASVSIASISHISGLMHIGINIETDKDIPVPAIGLKEMYKNFDPYIWAEDIMYIFQERVNSIRNATMKVKGL